MRDMLDDKFVAKVFLACFVLLGLLGFLRTYGVLEK